MKKTYIIPSIEVVVMNPISMIAESLGSGTTSFDGAENGASGASGDVQSDKGWDIWGDD